jgi:hypothetical protein
MRISRQVIPTSVQQSFKTKYGNGYGFGRWDEHPVFGGKKLSDTSPNPNPYSRSSSRVALNLSVGRLVIKLLFLSISFSWRRKVELWKQSVRRLTGLIPRSRMRRIDQLECASHSSQNCIKAYMEEDGYHRKWGITSTRKTKNRLVAQIILFE